MDQKYQELVERNLGYIDKETQNKISRTRLLIAGCGIGSTIAEAAVRMGFRHFTLVDGDTVSQNNLNRQSYRFDQVGKKKAQALAENLKAINPDASVEIVCEYLNLENVKKLVGRSDYIFDTIDFLDLTAILALHDEALKQEKPLITAVACGWGAAAVYVPGQSRHQSWIRDIFHIPNPIPDNMSYVETFSHFFFNCFRASSDNRKGNEPGFACDGRWNSLSSATSVCRCPRCCIFSNDNDCSDYCR